MFLEEAAFSPWHVFVAFVKNQVGVNAWIHI
jgi:hypothetical protein